MVSKGTKFSETFKYGRIRVCKKADSGLWQLIFMLPKTGQSCQRSTGTTLKKEAIAEAEQLSTQLMNQTFGTADGTIPLKVMVDKYFTAKDGRIKTKSYKRLRTSVSTFMGWLSTTHPNVLLAKHLTPEVIREYQKRRQDNGLSKRTVNNDIKNLHSMFRWAILEDFIDKSPADYSKDTGTVPLYKLPRNEADVYEASEYHGLIAEASTRLLGLIRDLIIVFAGTGMRFEELAHLRKKNVYWNTTIPTIEVRAQNGWTPKDPREIKRIPMLPEVQEVVRRRFNDCKDSEDWLFKNSLGGKIHEGLTLGKLKELFPSVGINGDRRLFWHSFRNFFVIRCLKKGVAVPAIMKWTGHDSATMVLHYAEVISSADVYEEFKKVS